MKLSGKYSQSGQDKFAYNLCGENGTYIEVGAHDPKRRSNTYNLEVYAKWKGFGIELDISHRTNWELCPERKNKIYWTDALTFDYISAIKDNNLPMHINYLSCDIEPPKNTFAALKRIIESGITFDCITFEHDRYHCDIDYHQIAEDFLKKYGYKSAVTEVYAKNPNKIFETWFVSEKIKFKPLTYEEWKNKE